MGINITRVSYNKAVDSHTLFLDAEGSTEQLAEADRELAKIGYLQNSKNNKRVILLEFCLEDVPGSVTSYRPADPQKVTILWDNPEDQNEPLCQIGFLTLENCILRCTREHSATTSFVSYFIIRPPWAALSYYMAQTPLFSAPMICLCVVGFTN